MPRPAPKYPPYTEAKKTPAKSERRRTGLTLSVTSTLPRRFVTRGASAKISVAIPMSQGTTTLKVCCEPTRRSAVPASDPTTHGGTSSRSSFECVDNSLRNPRIPPSELGKIPTVEETFACKVGIPRATKVGKLKKVDRKSVV